MWLLRAIPLCALVMAVPGACSPFGGEDVPSEPAEGGTPSLPDASAPVDARGGGPGPCTFCDEFERSAQDVQGPWDTKDEILGSLKLVPMGAAGTALEVVNAPTGGSASKVALYKTLPVPRRRIDVALRVYEASAPTAGQQIQLFYVELVGTPTRRLSFELKDGGLRIQERVGSMNPYDYKAATAVGELRPGAWHRVSASVFSQGGGWAASARIGDEAGVQGAFSGGPIVGAELAVGDHSTSVTSATMQYDDVRVQVD